MVVFFFLMEKTANNILKSQFLTMIFQLHLNRLNTNIFFYNIVLSWEIDRSVTSDLVKQLPLKQL